MNGLLHLLFLHFRAKLEEIKDIINVFESIVDSLSNWKLPCEVERFPNMNSNYQKFRANSEKSGLHPIASNALQLCQFRTSHFILNRTVHLVTHISSTLKDRHKFQLIRYIPTPIAISQNFSVVIEENQLLARNHKHFFQISQEHLDNHCEIFEGNTFLCKRIPLAQSIENLGNTDCIGSLIDGSAPLTHILEKCKEKLHMMSPKDTITQISKNEFMVVSWNGLYVNIFCYDKTIDTYKQVDRKFFKDHEILTLQGNCFGETEGLGMISPEFNIHSTEMKIKVLSKNLTLIDPLNYFNTTADIFDEKWNINTTRMKIGRVAKMINEANNLQADNTTFTIIIISFGILIAIIVILGIVIICMHRDTYWGLDKSQVDTK